jgi:diguanylate cyclase (GGDEF)-like protein
MTRQQVKTAGRQAWLVYLGIGTAAIALYYRLPRAGVAQGVLLTVVNATAFIAAFRTVRRTNGLARIVWLALGAAMTLSTLANGPYYAYPLLTGRPVPFPCPVDIFWLLTYPCFLVALIALARQRRQRDRRGDALDTTLIVLGGTTLMWEFVITPVVRAAGLPFLTHAISVAYPVSDLIVLAMLIRLVVVGIHKTPASRLLVASFVALLVADVVYAIMVAAGTYGPGGPTDGLWMASYLLIGVAALHPSAREFPRSTVSHGGRITRGRFAFLCAAALTGPVVMAVRPKDVPFLAVATALSFLLVTARLTGVNKQLVTVSAELQRRATTDSLTGLANRAELYRHIEDGLSAEGAGVVSVLLIDLDNFKAVNDLSGHSAGDAVLMQVAQRLTSVVREEDLVARLGGDEFAILVKDPADARGLGDRILRTLGDRFVIDDREFALGASVGLVTGGGIKLERLVQNADIAMYAAKHRGKGRVVTFDASMYAEILERSDIAHELESAIDNEEIGIEYQPIVRLDSGAIVGIEALARWQDATLGAVPPSRFIPVAEESGLIVRLSRSVLQRALADLRRLDATTAVPLTLNVNVSSRQLREQTFSREVAEALLTAGIAPDRLILEVTESAMIEETSDAVRQLHELRALGVRIAIDDFGTGYSSLAYLRRLPVESLKIDRAFVNGIDRGAEDAAVAKAILRIADAMGLHCVAEGVERKEQIGLLRAAGCEFAQGFFFARAMPFERLCEFIYTSASSKPGPRGTVLVADNDQNLVRGIADHLGRAGFQVLEANSNLDAGAILSTQLVDLLLIGPGMGHEAEVLCRSLRTRASSAYLPILMVSGEDSDSSWRIEHLELGVDSFIPRAIEPAEVIATVRALLRPKPLPRGEILRVEPVL